MLNKTVRLSQLYDWYAPLLTEKQRKIFELYYHDDLSLAEIAAEQAVSRTAVHDTLVRTEMMLDRYEEALALADRFGEFITMVETADNLAANLKNQCGMMHEDGFQSLRDTLQRMMDIWVYDHTGEGA